jgi:hypothetical protein
VVRQVLGHFFSPPLLDEVEEVHDALTVALHYQLKVLGVAEHLNGFDLVKQTKILTTITNGKKKNKHIERVVTRLKEIKLLNLETSVH